MSTELELTLARSCTALACFVTQGFSWDTAWDVEQMHGVRGVASQISDIKELGSAHET